jgi:hypothetical protein
MPSLQFEAGYEAGYRDGVGIVTPWAQILIALGALRDEMPVDEVIAVQRFAKRLKNPASVDTHPKGEDVKQASFMGSAVPKADAQNG